SRSTAGPWRGERSTHADAMALRPSGCATCAATRRTDPGETSAGKRPEGAVAVTVKVPSGGAEEPREGTSTMAVETTAPRGREITSISRCSPPVRGLERLNGTASPTSHHEVALGKGARP